MKFYDFCVAWNWEYDADFIALLERACRDASLSLLQITPDNLAISLQALAAGELGFQVFLDRASEADSRFMALVQWVYGQKIFCLNSHERAVRASDKALMHPVLMHAGLYVPYTLMLPAYEEEPALVPADLTPLGVPFVIKPARGSGSLGVVMKVTSWEQVLDLRQEHGADRYLLQARIVPGIIDSHPAWFRVIYCTGQVYACWWHPRTHLYRPVTAEERQRHGLDHLLDMAATIARVCGLDLFSTEIALDAEGRFMVIDYVNDQIDLRLQSRAPDGVPDDIVGEIAGRLVRLAGVYCG